MLSGEYIESELRSLRETSGKPQSLRLENYWIAGNIELNEVYCWDVVKYENLRCFYKKKKLIVKQFFTFCGKSEGKII